MRLIVSFPSPSPPLFFFFGNHDDDDGDDDVDNDNDFSNWINLLKLWLVTVDAVCGRLDEPLADSARRKEHFREGMPESRGRMGGNEPSACCWSCGGGRCPAGNLFCSFPFRRLNRSLSFLGMLGSRLHFSTSARYLLLDWSMKLVTSLPCLNVCRKPVLIH